MELQPAQKEWQLRKNYLVIGKRNSGKTNTVIHDLYVTLQDQINDVYVISPTDKMTNNYLNVVTDHVYHRFTPYRINSLLEQISAERKENPETPWKERLLILDDCLSSMLTPSTRDSLANLIQHGRHYHLTVILTMQFPLGIGPDMRANFDYILLFQDDFKSNQKRLYDHYAGMFPTFNSFLTTFNQIGPHEYLLINNVYHVNTLNEKVRLGEVANLDNEIRLVPSQFTLPEKSDNLDLFVRLLDEKKALEQELALVNDKLERMYQENLKE